MIYISLNIEQIALKKIAAQNAIGNVKPSETLSKNIGNEIKIEQSYEKLYKFV